MRSMNSAGTLLAKIVNVLLFPIYPVAQGFWNITANVFCILLLSHKIYGQRNRRTSVGKAGLYSL